MQIVCSGSYVAFSHVWSHGLGNQCENSLPTCQLERLQAMASRVCQTKHRADLYQDELYEADRFQLVRMDSAQQLDSTAPAASHVDPQSEVAFWIDTLCIPIQELHKSSRKVAITRIDNTFQSAYRVLVLDKELQE